jgi:hypothetical protein
MRAKLLELTERTVAVTGACLLLAIFTVPVQAHHAFSAEFDSNKPVHIVGTVSKVEWVNPHAWIHVEVKKDDGTVENWLIEGGTPNSLFRRGITKKTLQPGMAIVIDGFQAKLDLHAAAGRKIKFPDGTQLFLGTSGVGAPDDGAEQIDK